MQQPTTANQAKFTHTAGTMYNVLSNNANIPEPLWTFSTPTGHTKSPENNGHHLRPIVNKTKNQISDNTQWAAIPDGCNSER